MAKEDKIHLRDIYNEYKEYSAKPVPYKLFKDIFIQYIQRVVDNWILEGKEFNLGHRLGFLRVIHRKRDYSKLSVNFNETNKARKETGDNSIIIYYTDDEWFRYNWMKSRCYVKNKTVWKFIPTRDNGTLDKPRGLKNKLSAVLSNPANKIKFKFVS